MQKQVRLHSEQHPLASDPEWEFSLLHLAVGLLIPSLYFIISSYSQH